MCRNFPGRQGKGRACGPRNTRCEDQKASKGLLCLGNDRLGKNLEHTGWRRQAGEEAGCGELGVNALGKLGLAAFPSRGGCYEQSDVLEEMGGWRLFCHP